MCKILTPKEKEALNKLTRLVESLTNKKVILESKPDCHCCSKKSLKENIQLPSNKQEDVNIQQQVDKGKDNVGAVGDIAKENEEVEKEFTDIEDKKIKDISIDANLNISKYISNKPTGRKDKFKNDINEFEATNPFTNEKVVFKKKTDATNYVISEIQKAATKKGREEIFKSINKPTPNETKKDLKEGVWALPKDSLSRRKAMNFKQELQRIKNDIYDIAGSDELFDNLDGAIKELDALITIGKSQGFKRIMLEKRYQILIEVETVDSLETLENEVRKSGTFVLVRDTKKFYYWDTTLEAFKLFSNNTVVNSYKALVRSNEAKERLEELIVFENNFSDLTWTLVSPGIWSVSYTEPREPSAIFATVTLTEADSAVRFVEGLIKATDSSGLPTEFTIYLSLELFIIPE